MFLQPSPFLFPLSLVRCMMKTEEERAPKKKREKTDGLMRGAAQNSAATVLPPLYLNRVSDPLAQNKEWMNRKKEGDRHLVIFVIIKR